MEDNSLDEELAAIENFNMMEFGALPPDIGIFKQFSLGPWHELRRQMTLFFLLVKPVDESVLKIREVSSPSIEKRCDMWIVMFLNTKNRKGIVPPTDLRKWLGVRAKMALIFLEREIELKSKDKTQDPDLKKEFKAEIGSRLVIWWQEFAKEAWLKNDPDQSSTSE